MRVKPMVPNPSEHTAYMREWRARHPGAREHQQRWLKSKTTERRREALRILGGKCIRCGIDDERVLQIDHVYGDGHVRRPHLNGKRTTTGQWTRQEDVLKALRAGSNRFQILCANCHMIKTREAGEFQSREGRPKKVEPLPLFEAVP